MRSRLLVVGWGGVVIVILVVGRRTYAGIKQEQGGYFSNNLSLAVRMMPDTRSTHSWVKVQLPESMLSRMAGKVEAS